MTLPEVEQEEQVTASNIGKFVLSIVEYIRETRPDYIVANDRGARIIGLAVHMLYRNMHGRLPTVDGTLRFRRISKSNFEQDTEEHLRPLVAEMLRHKQEPRVLVLDDWALSGKTKELAYRVFDKLSGGRVKMNYGVLLGTNADISGQGLSTKLFAALTDWRDDPYTIGVDYKGTIPEVVDSTHAADYRREMSEGLTEFARSKHKKQKKVDATYAAIMQKAQIRAEEQLRA